VRLRAACVQVKEYAPPPPDTPDAPPSSLPLSALKAEGEAKQATLESWCRTAYGEVRVCVCRNVDDSTPQVAGGGKLRQGGQHVRRWQCERALRHTRLQQTYHAPAADVLC
jgi:hypothetical protein